MDTVHCLVDVDFCVNSNFAMLVEPAAGSTTYTVGYGFDEDGTAILVALAKTHGICTLCSGEGTLEEGFRAGISGTVVDASVDPPLVEIHSAEATTGSGTFTCE